jgi:DNA-binding helix-hairpin-helix protein with protein kinase domain
MTMKGKVLLNNQSLTLGAHIGGGGEGEVFSLQENPLLFAKIYKNPMLGDYRRKVEAMVALGLAHADAMVAYPNGTLFDAGGAFIGFTMQAITDCYPIHDLFGVGSRKKFFPGSSYPFLVRCATNLARAVAAVHSGPIVIGDINSNGILTKKDALVSLIDADSFQVTINGHVYPCRVGVGTYTPPELQGQRLNLVNREQAHDLFGLGVLIFQILMMGRHPFSGTYEHGDMAIEKAIAEKRYVYSQGDSKGMRVPPQAMEISTLPPHIVAAFEAALGADSPLARPRATEWVGMLQELEKNLRACPRSVLHHYSITAPHCPWCALESATGTVFFDPLPEYDSATGEPKRSRLSEKELAEMSASLDAVVAPPMGISPSAAAQVKPLPYWTAYPAWLFKMAHTFAGALLVLASAVAIFIAPGLLVLWAITGAMGVLGVVAEPIGLQALKERHKQTQKDLDRIIAECQYVAGGDSFVSTKQKLILIHGKLKAFDRELDAKLKELETEDNQVQLMAFLQQFAVDGARVAGVGAHSKAALLSSGIATAADITLNSIMAVPGIGSNRAYALLAWRYEKEQDFRPTASKNRALMQQQERTGREADKKRALLTASLRNGTSVLRTIREEVIAKQRRHQATVDEHYQRLLKEQATLMVLSYPHGK